MTLADELEKDPDYKVLRRLKTRTGVISSVKAEKLYQGLYIDLETTGLDLFEDEIIELAMLPFTYTPQGEIVEIKDPFSRVREPSIPISPKITQITGITDEMVRGTSIDPQEVASFAKEANLVIAHNASFDRPFLEAFSDAFKKKPWACTLSQIPWDDEGISSGKLDYLAMTFGFFFDGHRAIHDCRAGLELLLQSLPVSGRNAFDVLLENARKTTYYIEATEAPFEVKDRLKERGYFFNGKRRVWAREIDEELLEAEKAFLEEGIVPEGIQPLIKKVTALNRFSGV